MGRSKKVEKSLNEVFDFIVSYKQENDGNSPSIDDIKNNFGWTSKNRAYRRILELRYRGRIHFRDNIPRSISVPGGQWSIKQ